MGPNTVCVTRPGRWGNHYKIGPDGTREEVVEKYRRWLTEHLTRCAKCRVDIQKLRGKDLACYCRFDQPCHADVLLEIANG